MTSLGIATSADDARALLARSGSGRIELVAAGAGAVTAFLEAGAPFALVEADQDLQWAGRITDFAGRVSRTWWREQDLAGLAELLDDWRGIPIGRMIELPLYHVLSEAALSVLTAERLLDRVRPTRVIVAHGPPPAGGRWVGFSLRLRTAAVALVAASRGIELEDLAVREGRWLAAYLRAQPVPPPQPPSGDPLPEGPFALFYTAFRHGASLVPVLDELRASTLSAAALDCDADAGVLDAVRRLGVPIVTPEPPGPESATAAAHAGRVWASPRRGEALQRLGREEFGISLWPLVSFQIEWLGRHAVGEALEAADAALRTIEAWRPSALVTPVDSSIADLAWVYAARARDVPSVVQLHGALYSAPGPHHWGMGAETDVVAAWGPLSRDWYLEAIGGEPERFPLVGYAGFDALGPATSEAEARRTRAALGLDPDRPVVLFLVSMTGGAVAPLHGSELEIYSALFDAIAPLGNVQTIVRTHPVSDVETLRLAAVGRPGTILLNPEGTLDVLVGAADVIVGQPTSALVTAMLQDRPVVIFTHRLAREYLWWLEHGDLAHADGSELTAVLRSLLGGGAALEEVRRRQARFLDLLTGPRDGGAAKRTARLIEHVALTGSTSGRS